MRAIVDGPRRSVCGPIRTVISGPVGSGTVDIDAVESQNMGVHVEAHRAVRSLNPHRPRMRASDTRRAHSDSRPAQTNSGRKRRHDEKRHHVASSHGHSSG